MRKLRIPDSVGITGRTLGHTVKLPAAVTYIYISGYDIHSYDKFTFNK